MQKLLDQFRVIDLTHPLHPHVPTWNGSCGYCLEVKKDYDQMFCVQQIKMHAGVGTHMDAPSHRFENGASIGEIPLEQLIVPLCLLDVSDRAHSDYTISVADIEADEKKHGPIPKNSLVIGFTGWSRFWGDSDAYRNVDREGKMHFPAFSAPAAELLLTREIAGIAIDTLSPDCLDGSYPVHALILGAGKYIIENVADCTHIPPRGGHIIALPLRAPHTTECPLRLVALLSF